MGSIKYVFDVDGTLTPSRQMMNQKFENWFEQFATCNAVYLVTGSDREKTLEQIGNTIYNLAVRVYNCSGNDVYEQDRCIRTNKWTLPDLARTFLISCEYESDFSIRTGNHIEERPGTVNFSVVGRNATPEQRAAYVDFEAQNGERRKIADAFNTMFPDLEAKVGGETGIDIYRKGADKSQILVDFDPPNDTIYFFGDRMEPSGNDYPLAKALDFKNCFQPSNWQETWKLLQDIG